jgi:hypothetical protein
MAPPVHLGMGAIPYQVVLPSAYGHLLLQTSASPASSTAGPRASFDKRRQRILVYRRARGDRRTAV